MERVGSAPSCVTASAPRVSVTEPCAAAGAAHTVRSERFLHHFHRAVAGCPPVPVFERRPVVGTARSTRRWEQSHLAISGGALYHRLEVAGLNRGNRWRIQVRDSAVSRVGQQGHWGWDRSAPFNRLWRRHLRLARTDDTEVRGTRRSQVET